MSSTDLTRKTQNRGALIFAAVLALAVLGFAWSVVDEARRVTDWLLIAPAAILAAAAFLWAGVTDLRLPPNAAKAALPVTLVALTCAFAASAPFIGFDLATAAFILLCLLVQGDRSWWRLALASVGGAALMTWVFVDLLLVRLPVMLF